MYIFINKYCMPANISWCMQNINTWILCTCMCISRCNQFFKEGKSQESLSAHTCVQSARTYVCSECSYICVFTQGFNFVSVSTIFFIRILNCSDSGIILWREKSSLPIVCKCGEPCLFIILFMLKSAYKLHTMYINTFTIYLDFFSAVGLGSWCFHMTLLYSMQVQLKKIPNNALLSLNSLTRRIVANCTILNL